jgi:hypothetical protein
MLPHVRKDFSLAANPPGFELTPHFVLDAFWTIV